jgi:mannose-6-phosphate isomerase-like protein (cupin superfamily)
MEEFPEFMKKPANRINKVSQYTEEIEGYVFNGADGSQMAFWTCYQDRDSKEHTHDYDEYFVVVHGQYTIIIDGKEEPMQAGQECYISKGTSHSGKAIAGTRTIHCFGGKRV